MKRITVNAYQLALVTKRGKLVRVLSEGKHWIGFSKKFTIHDLTERLDLRSHELIVNVESALLKDHINIVDILDNEIGIEYKEDKYHRVLVPGKYAYWNSPIKYQVKKVNMSDIEVSKDIPRHILMQPAVLQYLRVYPVESYQKALLYVDGNFVRILEPGVYHFWKTNDIATVKTIDTRLLDMEVVGQEILTKDKAGIRVNFSAQYKVIDIQKAVIDTKDYVKQLYTLLQLTMRSYLANLTLDQLLGTKDTIGKYILENAAENADNLGVKIISGGIKDVILPGDVKEIMNQVLIAQKKAQANTIMRQEETASTRSLLNTAKLMEQNTMLMKLKEMEYMEKISEKIGEISVNGGSGVLDQLKQLVIAK